MPDGFKTRNRWGTFKQATLSADDVFADPNSVVDAQGFHFEFSEYSTGEVLLALHPICHGQPRLMRARRSQETCSDEQAAEQRFGFRRLVETFVDPVFKRKVELWELGDSSWAVRLHNLDNGAASIFFEIDMGCTHRPF